MEQYHQNSFLSIIYEERSSQTSVETPTTLNHHDDQNILYDVDGELQDYPYYLSPPIPSSPARGPPHGQYWYPPPSPESPWTCSPLQTPSPSLLYHCIASLRRHDGTIHSIAAAPNGLVFTGSESRRVRAWRAPDCAERGLLKAKAGEVRAMALAHGDTLFTSHRDNKVRVWAFNPFNFSFKKLPSIPRRPARSLITSPLSLFSRRLPRRRRPHTDAVSCMAYHHAEDILYTGSFDRSVKAWRVSSGKCVDSFLAHEDRLNAMLVSQDDGCLFTCSSDGSVKLWRRIYRENSHTLTMILRFQNSPVNAMALSTAFFLYSGASDGTINFWERERSSFRFNHGGFLQGHRFAVLCLVALEKMVFSGSEDTTIRIWRREEGSCLHECMAVLDGHRGPVRCLAASLEVERVVMMGFLVYSASLDQTFKVWRVKVLPEDHEHPPMVCCMDIDDLDHDHDHDHDDHHVIERSGSVSAAAAGGASPVLSPSWVERKRQGTYFQ